MAAQWRTFMTVGVDHPLPEPRGGLNSVVLISLRINYNTANWCLYLKTPRDLKQFIGIPVGQVKQRFLDLLYR